MRVQLVPLVQHLNTLTLGSVQISQASVFSHSH